MSQCLNALESTPRDKTMSKEKEGIKLIGFYAPETTLQKIAEVARNELCSKSDVCRKAVLSYLEKAVRNQMR
jgi:hypothetical protein